MRRGAFCGALRLPRHTSACVLRQVQVAAQPYVNIAEAFARHDGDVGAELGSLQVRTPERVAAEIAQLKADRQARVRRAKKLN